MWTSSLDACRGGATAWCHCQLTTMNFRKLSVKYCSSIASKVNDTGRKRCYIGESGGWLCPWFSRIKTRKRKRTELSNSHTSLLHHLIKKRLSRIQDRIHQQLMARESSNQDAVQKILIAKNFSGALNCYLGFWDSGKEPRVAAACLGELGPQEDEIWLIRSLFFGGNWWKDGNGMVATGVWVVRGGGQEAVRQPLPSSSLSWALACLPF